MPTQIRAFRDQILTNVSIKIKPVGYISEMILPLLNHAQYSGDIGGYGNDHMRIVNTVAGGKSGYATVESDVRTTDGFKIETHALKLIVTKEDKRNVPKPWDAERDATSKLTTHLWLGKEKSLADALGDTGVLTKNVTLSGTDQYNDYTNSDPVGDAVTAHNSIYDNTGIMSFMLTAIMSWKVFRTLKFHPGLLDALGFKDQRPGGLSQDEIARALEVKKVLIGSAIFNDSKEGQTDDLKPVWAENLVYAALPDTAQLEQVSLGYRVQLAGQQPRQVFKSNPDEPIDSTKIIVLDEYDQVLTKTDAAYLIKNAIA